MTAPRFVLVEMGEYEKVLADARAMYRRVRDASSAPEREAAQRAYNDALQKARLIGARLAKELDGAARAA